jgi:ectoine hydroxylase-related dioxygenase (phytanoyl-CoA dioxygenase family)
MLATVREHLSDEQVETFHRDGFLIIEDGFISESTIEALRERFDRLFAGEYATGIQPDEVNWKAGRDPEDLTRQICNGWRADDVIAAQVLSERTGRIAAQLMGYGGARMLQDNCLWKPPGARSLGMHQDGAYADYLVPAEMITCWVALDDTRAEGGTIEYARGSHRWPKIPPDRGSFHAPEDWLAPLRAATPQGEEPELVPVVVKAGGCSLHHSLMFHGSGPNQADTHRRALVSHLLPAHARFHPTNVDPTYSRYRRRGDLSMDESFFPVLYDETGGRTPWLEELPNLS